MKPLLPTCSLGLSGEILSNWQAHFITGQEYHQIATHLPQCPACQHTLAGYDRVIAALHAQTVPPLPPERVWRSVQRMIATGDSMRFSARAKIISAASVLGMIGIVTIFAVVLSDFGKKPGISIQTTPGITSTLALTPSPTQPIASSPWVEERTIPFATYFAFSTREPTTGFACGSINGTIHLSITHTSGASWSQPATTGIVSGGCEVFVNPNDSHELVLMALRCWVNCDLVYNGTYRSFDSGATWKFLTVPPGNEAAYFTALASPVWVGNALFFPTAHNGYGKVTAPYHMIAVSVNRGNLVWSGQQGLLTNFSNVDPYIAASFAVGSTYFVQFAGPFCQQSVCPLAATQNGGATWTRISPPTLMPNTVVYPVADGKTLLGQTSDGYAQSVDGGATWNALPNLPGTPSTIFGSTPDGTIYINRVEEPAGAIIQVYKLTPGQRVWINVTDYPTVNNGLLQLTFVTWNAGGHPLKIWELYSLDASGFPTPTPPAGSSKITWQNAPLCGQVCPGPVPLLESHGG